MGEGPRDHGRADHSQDTRVNTCALDILSRCDRNSGQRDHNANLVQTCFLLFLKPVKTGSFFWRVASCLVNERITVCVCLCSWPEGLHLVVLWDVQNVKSLHLRCHVGLGPESCSLSCCFYSLLINREGTTPLTFNLTNIYPATWPKGEWIGT